MYSISLLNIFVTSLWLGCNFKMDNKKGPKQLGQCS